jgi:hypothetical protein
MLKRITLAGTCLLLGLLLAPLPAQAQASATLVLRSGERVSGDLLDHGGVGFTVRVNGQERQITESDVISVEFTNANLTDDIRTRLTAGKQLVVLRNGEVIEGRLYDIGGTTPLNLTVDTSTGRRSFTSNEVARIYYAAPPDMAAATSDSAAGQATTTLPPGAIRVEANIPWNNTGIIVRRGDRVSFSTTGQINFSQAADSTASPDGGAQVRGNQLPIPAMGVGGLIARVGNSAPFPVGSNSQPIEMPADGPLMLGVNDNLHGDNSGFFAVVITRNNR